MVEKHGDFVGEFRGDTIYASTLTVLDELGLGEEFARLDRQRVGELHVAAGEREWPLADFGLIPGRHREFALSRRTPGPADARGRPRTPGPGRPGQGGDPGVTSYATAAY